MAKYYVQFVSGFSDYVQIAIDSDNIEEVKKIVDEKG